MLYRKKDYPLTALYNPRTVYKIQIKTFFCFWKTIARFDNRKDRDFVFDLLVNKKITHTINNDEFKNVLFYENLKLVRKI